MVVIGGLGIELDDEEHPPPSSESSTISAGVHALRLATMQWYTLPSLSTPRFAAAVCTLLDGRIFVAGGITTKGENILANPEVFVEEGRSMRGQPDYEAGGFEWRGRNSQRGDKSNVVELFNPIDGSWSNLPPLPNPRAGAKACVDAKGGRILVIGGSTDFRDFSRDVEVFDLATNAWLTTSTDQAPPQMNGARTEFALTRIPDKGILVVGGTNRYLWPNSPLTAEFYDFSNIAAGWKTLPPPPVSEYAEPGTVETCEQIGCECTLFEDNRYVVIQGGMSISPEYTVPVGRGNETDSEDDDEDMDMDDSPRKSEMDCWWESTADDSSDGYGDGGYDKRLDREFGMHVYDLKLGRWIDEKHSKRFENMERARTGRGVWNARGDTLLVVGGNYQFYSTTRNHQYPSHGTSQEVFVVDGPKGKRLSLPWSRYMRRSVTAAGIANIDNLYLLAQKHGWEDLRLGANVELRGMKSESYNGRRGEIVRDMEGGATGRWGVRLEGERKSISIKAECLRVLS
jgi:hypothetical protein